MSVTGAEGATSSGHRWRDSAKAELAGLDSRDLLRKVRTLDGGGARGELDDGRAVVNFASNDYLGLSQHPLVKDAATDAIGRWGTGAGASRLVTGSRPIHCELEGALAAFRSAEAALVFSSGYAANTGTIPAIAGEGVAILSDELNHASIVDGCRLARARGASVSVYRHGDLDHLRSLLDRQAGRVVVVTDTVFSMDGDVAPVKEISELCAARGALLVLDDAHDVMGAPSPSPGCEVLRVGTLSKSLGSQGGYVAGTAQMVELLVNRARPFVFSTGLAPADAAAALAAVRIVKSPEGAALLARLRRNVDRVRPGLPSPIVPIVVGSESAALQASARLLEVGMLIPAIRPPTVPRGTSRLRIALSAAHDDEEVDALVAALGRLGTP